MSSEFEIIRQFFAEWNCEERHAPPPPQAISVVRQYKPYSAWVEEYCRQYPMIYVAVDVGDKIFVLGDVRWEEVERVCRPLTVFCRHEDARKAVKALIDYAVKSKRLTWVEFAKEALLIAGYCDHWPDFCEPEMLVQRVDEVAQKRGDERLLKTGGVDKGGDEAREDRGEEAEGGEERRELEELLRLIESRLGKVPEKLRRCLRLCMS